jgi:large subunit ribosomal protein L10
MLADLPSLEVLRAKLLGLFSAPASQLVRLLNTPASQMARVLQARVDKPAEAEPPAAAQQV